MIRVVNSLASPPFEGIKDGVVKVVDSSVGANTIVLFLLAIAQTKNERSPEANSKPQQSL